MPGGGTRTFIEVGKYEAALRQAEIGAAIVSDGKFNARLTLVELHHLQLLRCEEDAARAAFLRLASGLSFVTFPAYHKPLPIWRGTQLRVDDVTFHCCGGQLHQQIPNSFVWSVIAVKMGELDRYSRALSGEPLAWLPDGPILQLIPRHAARLRRVHAQACRLAETKSRMLSHPEVARAIENDLIEALVTCLKTAKVRTEEIAARRRAAIMTRFGEILVQHLSRLSNIPEISQLVGVSARTLRACCTRFLGNRFAQTRRSSSSRWRLRR